MRLYKSLTSVHLMSIHLCVHVNECVCTSAVSICALVCHLLPKSVCMGFLFVGCFVVVFLMCMCFS
jgi:hypothetical protein